MDVESLEQLTAEQEQSISQLETELRTLQQETSSREGLYHGVDFNIMCVSKVTSSHKWVIN